MSHRVPSIAINTSSDSPPGFQWTRRCRSCRRGHSTLWPVTGFERTHESDDVLPCGVSDHAPAELEGLQYRRLDIVSERVGALEDEPRIVLEEIACDAADALVDRAGQEYMREIGDVVRYARKRVELHRYVFLDLSVRRVGRLDEGLVDLVQRPLIGCPSHPVRRCCRATVILWRVAAVNVAFVVVLVLSPSLAHG